MTSNSHKQLFVRLLLITTGFLLVSLSVIPVRAANGTINSNVGYGSTVYYKVGGWTEYAYFQLSFISSFDLQLRLYEEDGDLIATGSTGSSTTRTITEYLSGGETYYLAITYLSGTGAASFTLTYQDVYTISFHGNSAPFLTADDKLLALAIGAPIIIGVGFAIIGLFGRMKIQQRKSEIPLGAPSQLLNLGPTTSPLPPLTQKPATVASPRAPDQPTPTVKYCPYCGSEVVPGSKTCKGCGNSLY